MQPLYLNFNVIYKLSHTVCVTVRFQWINTITISDHALYTQICVYTSSLYTDYELILILFQSLRIAYMQP